MKRYLFSIVLVLSYCSIFAQYDYYTTIKTPTNVSIEAIYRVEYSANDLAKVEAQAAAWINRYGSQAIRVAPASRTYNCHNFAWHSSDGGSRVWINQNDQYGAANLSKYWSGSSPTYVQTTSSKATKVFYSNGDHSAKTISSSLYESKWGEWPRYRHSPSDCPYTSSNLQYYYVPVSGDDVICSSKTYSTLSISGASYNWSRSGVSISGSGSSLVATKTSNGSGWIQAQISSPYSGTTLTSEKKSFTLGTPTPSINARKISGSGEPTEYEFTTTQFIGAIYNWYVNSILNSSYAYPNNLFDWYFPANVTKTIKCNIANSCGTSAFSNSITKTGEYKWGHNYSIYPNPASSEITISQIEIKDANFNEDQQKPKLIKSIKVIDNFGVTYIVKNFENETYNTTINISNLPHGIYLIKINEGEEAESYTLLKN